MDQDLKQAIHDTTDEINLAWEHVEDLAKKFVESKDRRLKHGLYHDLAAAMVSLRVYENEYRTLVGAE